MALLKTITGRNNRYFRFREIDEASGVGVLVAQIEVANRRLVEPGVQGSWVIPRGDFVQHFTTNWASLKNSKFVQDCLNLLVMELFRVRYRMIFYEQKYGNLLRPFWFEIDGLFHCRLR